MKNSKAYIYLVLTTAIWGSMYVFAKYVFVAMHPFILLFIRFLIGFLALSIYYFFKGGKIKGLSIRKSDFKYVFCVGFFGYFLGIGLQLLGTDYCDASLASLINSINPVIIIVLALIILKEKVTRKQAFSVAVALLGTVIIIGQIDDIGSVWGALISFGAVICWSLGSVIVRLVSEKYDSLVITIWAMLIGCIFALPVSLVQYQFAPVEFHSIDGMFIFSFVFICLISTAISFLLWNKALSLVSAATCSLFYPIQPLVSAILGIVLLNEVITINFVFGGVLIIFGILFSVLSKKNRKHHGVTRT